MRNRFKKEEEIAQKVITMAGILAEKYNVRFEVLFDSNTINVTYAKKEQDALDFYESLEKHIFQIYEDVEVIYE